MLKIAAALGICDSLAGTPAEKKIETAVQMAKTKDRSKLQDIYSIICEVERYLGENQ